MDSAILVERKQIITNNNKNCDIISFKLKKNSRFVINSKKFVRVGKWNSVERAFTYI